MTASKRKARILHNMSILLDARKYLLDNNKSFEAQKEIRENHRYDGFLVEIESPLFGDTIEWIRLCYDDVYLYLDDDGSELYQLDPMGECGGELINVTSYEEFVKELEKIDYDLEEYYVW